MSKTDKSICWDCIHSAAPVGMACIWDITGGRVPVEGARIIQEYRGLNNGKRSRVGVVVKCPEFETLYNLKNQEMVRRAREDAKKNLYAKYYLQQNSGNDQRLSANEVRAGTP